MAVPVAAPAERRGGVRALLVGLRPRQWAKNLIVWTAPAAAGLLGEPAVLARTAGVFVAFCAASSAGYLVNDVLDVDADRAHPRKRDRPVAAGELTGRGAVTAAVVLAVGGVALAAAVRPLAGVAVAAYLALTALYSWRLKHVAVIDLLAIATGFLLRAGAGAAAASVGVTSWFLTVLGFGALAVAAGKRTSELLAGRDEALTGRRSLASYSVAYLAQVEAVAVAGALLAYAQWAFDGVRASGAAGVWVQVSVLPFAAALLRYLLLAGQGRAEEPEQAVLDDAVLAASGVVWVVCFGLGIALR